MLEDAFLALQKARQEVTNTDSRDPQDLRLLKMEIFNLVFAIRQVYIVLYQHCASANIAILQQALVEIDRLIQFFALPHTTVLRTNMKLMGLQYPASEDAKLKQLVMALVTARQDHSQATFPAWLNQAPKRIFGFETTRKSSTRTRFVRQRRL